LETLLLALVADDLLQLSEGRFKLAPEVAPYLQSDGQQTMASIIRHHHHCMLRWAGLADVLRSGQPVPRAAGGRSEQELRDFICGMENISRTSSSEVAQKVDLSRFRRMLDLGGGPGTSAIVFAQRYPQLQCVVFDLPEVVRIAGEQIARAQLTERITTRAGDFHADELGQDYDLVYISNIIHSLGPDAAALLFAKAHRALAAQGTVIVKDFFLDASRTRPATAARFSVNMLVSTPAGRSYTLEQAQQMRAAAGFADFQTISVATASRLLMARKR
jgi:SAM-dependent methyltransferase